MNIYELINNEKNLEIINNKNIDSSNNNDSNNCNLCLISNKPLDDNHLILDCNHKFNYEDLYNEYVYQQTNKNYYDIYKPFAYQTKCPYCRTITNKVVPYFKPLLNNEYKQIHTNKNFETIKLYECTYIGKSSTENCKMNCCITEFGKLCNKHYTIRKNANNKKLLKEKIKQNNYKKILDTNNNTNNLDNILPEYDIDTIDNLQYYLNTNKFHRLKIPQLKLLLKINNCKISGNKTQLIERIILKKNEYTQNNIIWNDTIYKAIEE